MAVLYIVAGALVLTFLVSRLFLWLLKWWNAGWTRLAVAHALSLAAITGFRAWRDGGAFAIDPAVVHILPQAIWFGVDAWRHRRAAAALAAGRRPTP